MNLSDSIPRGRSPFAGALILLAVSLGTLAIQMIPDAAQMLQWQRSGPDFPFDWLTGHLTHWSWDHLIWDLGVFVALSISVLRLAPIRYVPCLLISAILIPLEIVTNQLQFDTYRGLSGVDSALFGLLVVALWRIPSEGRSISLSRIVAIIGGLGFLSKSIFEMLTGQTVFVSNVASEFVPVASAHLVGFTSGVVSGLIFRKKTKRLERRRTETSKKEHKLPAPTP